MKKTITMFVMAAFLCAGGYAYADPPDHKQSREWQKTQEMNKGDYGKHRDRDDDYDRNRYDRGKHRYFTDDHRDYIQKNYVNRYNKRHCPPGLAKKKNGCMPRGQAKKYSIGRPLPRTVVFYDLPRNVRDHLGPPPPHHRFVRVAQDILLIAVGTGMVIDAIDDLQWEFNR